VISQSKDAALTRSLIGRSSRLTIVDADPYRAAEQVLVPLRLRRERLALVHFPHYNLPLLHIVPFVVTVHDLFSFDFPEIHSGPLPRTINRMLLRSAVKHAERIITPSAATAAALVERFPQVRNRVVPIAEAADSRFSRRRDRSAEAAWQARLGIRPPYLLYLGQWKAYKNLQVLLQAFAAVRAALPAVQLVVAGDDPRHPEVRALATELPAGSVVFPGRLPEAAVPDVYRGAAAVVLPSRAEGFGLPVIEAMACGIPVVCSDLPVLHEIADGIAIFCDPASPESFSRGILQALQNPPSDPARQQAAQRASAFSWERAAGQTASLYDDVLAGGAPRSSRSVRVPLEEDAGAGEREDLEVQG
jgi:alpha-1,3-rhamnosyl/mannosyltransferase